MSKFRYTGNQPYVLTEWSGTGKKRKAKDTVLSKGGEYELSSTEPKVKKLVSLKLLEEVKPVAKAAKGAEETKSSTKS